MSSTAWGGNDTISGLNVGDVICGGEGNDTLSGNNGSDQLFGENGTDTLNGNNGNDALDGGAGTTDTCNGGQGSDSCESVTSIPSPTDLSSDGRGMGRARPAYDPAISGPPKPVEAAGAQVPRTD